MRDLLAILTAAVVSVLLTLSLANLSPHRGTPEPLSLRPAAEAKSAGPVLCACQFDEGSYAPGVLPGT